jgi:hypothetical protein
MFKTKHMLKNVAKGKKINTTEDFVKVFSNLTLKQKLAVSKNITDGLKTGVSPRGTKIKDDERSAIEQLSRWCGVNILVGNDLCPPESLHKY